MQPSIFNRFLSLILLYWLGAWAYIEYRNALFIITKSYIFVMCSKTKYRIKKFPSSTVFSYKYPDVYYTITIGMDKYAIATPTNRDKLDSALKTILSE